MLYIVLYLIAIILANISVAIFGVNASIINSFLFIGLDLTSRDKLHETWHNNGLIWKMGLLIFIGSLLSWLLNKDAGQIAIASFVSFSVSALIDTFIYQILHKQKYMIKVNGSNIVSAASDSIIFPTIAFGGFSLWITLAQFGAKILGGFMWAFILNKRNKSKVL